ncbi:unnamed protein product [Closterium sp. NIES-65]|nr:unnamed protein product [Closterium sp. NIES-65]
MCQISRLQPRHPGVELPSRVPLLFPLCLHVGLRRLRLHRRLPRSLAQTLNPDQPTSRGSPLSLVLPPTACPTQFPNLSSSSVFPSELLAGSWVILPLVAASFLAARFPDAHGPSPAPGRLGAGWARSFTLLLYGAAPEAAPVTGRPVPSAAWPRPHMLTVTAAADILADSAAVGADGSFRGCTGCLATSATTAAISISPRGDKDNATSGASESSDPCSTYASSAAATPCTGGVVGPAVCAAAGAIESPSEAAAGTAAASECASRPIPVESASATTPCSPRHVKSGPAAATSPRALPPLVEQRVVHVGTCLTLMSYILDQLHVCLARKGLEVGGMLPAERSAAVAAATEMLHYLPLIGLVPDAPGAALGPGPRVVVRLAESAREGPLGLVSAAASVLHWIDGRLCWILAK